MVALLALFVGCAPEPASIKFDGEAKVTVNKLDAVEVQKATVLDKDGKPLDPQPKDIAWKVDPAAVATLAGTKVTPVANGEAKVSASVGTVTNSYTFVVALPDKVEVAGYSAPVAPGATVQLTATVKAGDMAVAGETVSWESSKPEFATVDANGLVTGVAAGMSTITAKSGALSSTVDVTVGDAAAVAATEPAK